MITSAKNYSKKKKKLKTDRTIGQMVKIKLYRQNHTNPPLEFGIIRCLFRYSTDAGTSR